MKIACYPGSFDPITKGHLDIIQRSSKLFDKVIVTIMTNSSKKTTFTPSERQQLVKKCIGNLSNVEVVVGKGLTIEFASKLGANVLIRGIRAVADYEYELQQATANMMLDETIETIFFIARPEYSFLSSSVAKEIATYGREISKFVPQEIQKEVIGKLQKPEK
ncbi:MAG: pantetheine-phosphate adenylyltransferase [Anaerorhabdus sp.]